MLNVKGYLPMLPDTRVQPFILAGGGIRDQDVATDFVGPLAGVPSDSEDATEFAYRVGAGIDLYATENAMLTVEGAYFISTGDLDEEDFWSILIGLQYRF